MTIAASAEHDHVPWPLTPLVGREREITALRALVRDPDARLVVLTGPGGVGKSRLALRLAEEVRGAFDRLAFVPLATVDDPILLLPSIAQAIGVPEVGDAPLEDRLVSALDQCRTLLLIDNFEQIVSAAPLVGSLVVRSPRLTVIVTSRAPLKVQGEREFPVLPLRLPPARGAETSVSRREAQRFGAIALFAERARAADPAFKLTDENAPVVTEICRRLDGLPLAIELAAARMRIVSAPALLSLLDSRLDLLTGGPQDQPERLRTMRAAIAWSFDLLSPAHQAVFRRLSVFDGGFSLDAARSVIGAGAGRTGDPASPSRELDHASDVAVLDAVAALAEQSLIHRGEWPGDAELPYARFVMLETIREFGVELLAASGEADAVRACHARVFLELAERAEQDLTGPHEREWLDTLEAETQNIRAALGWSSNHDPAAAIRIGAALWLFWYRTGRVSEGEAWLGQALEDGPLAPDSVRGKGLFVWGALAGARGDFRTAVARLEQALALLAGGEDRAVEALAETSLGIYTMFGGDPAAAVAPLQRAEQLYAYAATPMTRTLGAFSRAQLGMALHLLGEREAALRYLEESVARVRGSGSTIVALPALSVLATLCWNAGEVNRAADLWREALALAWTAGERWLAVDPLYGLAAVAAAQGEVRRALRVLGAVDACCAGAGTTPLIAKAMTGTVEVAASLFLTPEEMAVERASGAMQALGTVVAGLLDEPMTRDLSATKTSPLSPREREVLRLLAHGRSDPEIAAALFVSRRTVATHVANLFRKLGVHSRAAASAYAVREGLA